LGVAEVLGDAPAARDHLRVDGLDALAGGDRAPVEHAAHAGHLPGEGDVPEPAVLEDVEADVAFLAPGPAPRPAEVGEESDLAEPGNALAASQAGREEAVAPARVHPEDS